MTPEFDIVIVHYKGDVEKCLTSSHWDDLMKGESRCRVIANSYFDGYGMEDVVAVGENIGWVKACNAGLALATAPYVVLMNDDTEVVTPGWLEKLREPMLKDDRIGMVGPVSNFTCIQNQLVHRNRKLVGEDSDDWFIQSPLVRSGGPLSFFCVMLRREMVVDIGYLDEQFGIGLGEDDDYQRRADFAGWRIAIQPTVQVNHDCHQSWDSLEQRAQLQRKNALLLQNKHK